MARLTALLIPTLLICSVCTAHGQTFRFTVAGDVGHADTWEGSYSDPDQPVYLLDLLKKADFRGEGNAVILRGESLQSVGCRFISTQMSTNPEPLMNGDIVILHQISRNPHLTENIVIINDSTRHVVPLSEIDNRLGNLLMAASVRVPVNHRIPIIRTQKGRWKACQVRPWDVLRHGDVVQLDNAGIPDNAATIRINELFRTVSDSVLPTVSEQVVQKTGQELSDQLVSGAGKIGDFNLKLPPLGYGRSSSITETSRIPVLPAAVESVISQDRPHQSPNVSSAVPANDVIPNGPEFYESTSIWNGVFIFGLLGSVALILTGWLKTHSEGSAATKRRTDSKFSLQRPQQSPAPGTCSSLSDDTAESGTQPEFTTQTASLSKFRASSVERVGASMVAADSSTPSEPVSTSVTGTQTEVPEQSHQIKPAVNVPCSDHLSPVSPVTDRTETDKKPSSKTVYDLEDMIRNRIPINVKQTDLPLRVTLFGRPAGPRRLRIDAAHTRVDKPNFAAGSRVDSESPQTRSTTTAASEQERHDGASLDRALNSLNKRDHS